MWGISWLAELLRYTDFVKLNGFPPVTPAYSALSWQERTLWLSCNECHWKPTETTMPWTSLITFIFLVFFLFRIRSVHHTYLPRKKKRKLDKKYSYSCGPSRLLLKWLWRNYLKMTDISLYHWYVSLKTVSSCVDAGNLITATCPTHKRYSFLHKT